MVDPGRVLLAQAYSPVKVAQQLLHLENDNNKNVPMKEGRKGVWVGDGFVGDVPMVIQTQTMGTVFYIHVKAEKQQQQQQHGPYHHQPQYRGQMLSLGDIGSALASTTPRSTATPSPTALNVRISPLATRPRARRTSVSPTCT